MSEKPRILIVDDESTLQRLLALTLRSEPWQVDAVGTAEQGLEFCRDHPVDVLLLDKNLPGMSGPEMLRVLRNEGNTVSCILMTAYASVSNAIETMSLGIDGYLEKPFPKLELVNVKIKEILERRQGRARRTESLAEARSHFRNAQAALGNKGLSLVIGCAEQADRDFVNAQVGDGTAVQSAAELLASLTETVDLVVLDAALADGVLTDLVTHVRHRAPDAGLILLTTSQPLSQVTALIDAGVDALVERPLDAAGFRSNTEHLLRRLRAR